MLGLFTLLWTNSSRASAAQQEQGTYEELDLGDSSDTQSPHELSLTRAQADAASAGDSHAIPSDAAAQLGQNADSDANAESDEDELNTPLLATIASSGDEYDIMPIDEPAASDFSGPDGVDYGTEPVSYSQGMDIKGNTSVNLGDGGTDNENVGISFGTIETDANIKLTGNPEKPNYALTTNLSEAKTLWITGGGRFLIDGNVFGTNNAGTYGPEEVYVTGAQLWFGPWVNHAPNFTGTTKLRTSFFIGACNFQQLDQDKELPALSYAALRVGTTVETTGGLTLLDDAKIGFQSASGNVGALSFDKAVSGAGYKLTVATYSSDNTLTFGQGGTLGSLDLGAGVTLSLGADLHLGAGESTINGTVTGGGKLVLGDGAEVTWVGVTALADLSKLEDKDSVLAQDQNAVNGGGSIVLTSGTMIGADNSAVTAEGHQITTSFGVVLKGSNQLYDFNNASFTVGGNVKVESGATLKVRNSSIATIKGTIDVQGTFQHWGSGTVTLEKGGYINDLDMPWGSPASGGFVLGDDLEVTKIGKPNSPNTKTFGKMEGVSERVHLIFRKGADETKTWKEFRDQLGESIKLSDVGLGISGGHNLTLNLSADGSSNTIDTDFIVKGTEEQATTLTVGGNLSMGKGTTLSSNGYGKLALSTDVEFSGVTFAGEFADITLAGGSQLSLGSGSKLDAKALTLTGSAGLSLTVNDGASLSFDSVNLGGNQLTITLTGVTLTGDSVTYDIFTGMNSEVLESLSGSITWAVEGMMADVTLDTQTGKITVKKSSYALYWQGDNTTLQWKSGSDVWSETEGQDGTNPYKEASVVLSGSGSNTVELGANIEAGDVTVKGADLFTFQSASDGTYSLAVRENLIVGSAIDVQTAISVDKTLSALAEGDGSTSGNITIGGGGSLEVKDTGDNTWSGALTLQDGGKLTLHGALTATTLTVGDNPAGGGSAGVVVLSGEDSSFTVSGAVSGDGKTLEVQGGTLSMTGGGTLGSLKATSSTTTLGGTWNLQQTSSFGTLTGSNSASLTLGEAEI